MFQEIKKKTITATNSPAKIDVPSATLDSLTALKAAAPSITLTVTDNHCQRCGSPLGVRASVVFEAIRGRERRADAWNSR